MKESIFDLPVFESAFEDLAKVEMRQPAELKQMIAGWIDDFLEGVSYFEDYVSPACKEKLLKLEESEAMDNIFEAYLQQRFNMAAPLGIQKEELEEMYQIARSHAEETDLSRKLFTTLIFLDFTDSRFWLGLAYGFVKNKEDSKARKAYELALDSCFQDPLPCLYYAKYLKMEKDPLAESIIEEGIRRASIRPEDKALLTELNTLKKK